MKLNKYEIIRYGVGFVFPPHCPVCDQLLDEPGELVHDRCMSMLYPVSGSCCLHCGRMITGKGEYCPDCIKKYKNGVITFAQGKGIWQYKGEIKKTMYRFKYSNRREYGFFFAKMASAKYSTWIRNKKVEAILPVPMFRKKERRRGYNQACVFAKYLSRELGIPVVDNLVSRIIDTTPMKGLDDKNRKKNLKNAFQTANSIVKYSYILVVDDIYTTGSTADALVAEIKQNGIKEVYFLSICIGQEI